MDPAAGGQPFGVLRFSLKPAQSIKKESIAADVRRAGGRPASHLRSIVIVIVIITSMASVNIYDDDAGPANQTRALLHFRCGELEFRRRNAVNGLALGQGQWHGDQGDQAPASPLGHASPEES